MVCFPREKSGNIQTLAKYSPYYNRQSAISNAQKDNII